MKIKKNTQFLILQTIGIILVVLGHKGGIELFDEWFPMYSFHMPLFVFISGYFYKIGSTDNIIKFIKSKTNRLLIPYFIWNFIYGVIYTLLFKLGIIDYSSHGASLINFESLFISPFIHGHQFVFNLATWFVLILFLIQVTYTIFRKIFKYIAFSNEYLIMIIFLVVGLVAVFLANHGYIGSYKYPIIKTMFLIPFFHLGYLYKNKLESKDNLNNTLYFAILFIIQFILLKKYTTLGFSVAWLNTFNHHNILLPFMTSLTGILFWLRISRILVKSFEDSYIIEYVGSHTWDIMTHHIFVFFVINLILSKISPFLGLNFNSELFRTSVWYTFIPINADNIMFFYSVASIIIPLLIRYIIENKNIFKGKKIDAYNK